MTGMIWDKISAELTSGDIVCNVSTRGQVPYWDEGVWDGVALLVHHKAFNSYVALQLTAFYIYIYLILSFHGKS